MAKPTVSEIIDYYLNLLILQYKDKPNIRGTISALVDSAIAENILFDVRDAYELESASGSQLDVIGKYVGVDRFYEGLVLTGTFFGFALNAGDTGDPLVTGFATESDFETKEGRFLLQSDTLGSTLSLGDEDFRTLIKLKIITNNINHSQEAIDDSLFQFFGNDIIAYTSDRMDMTLVTDTSFKAILRVALEKDVIPRPMGVGLNYFIIRDQPFFGFALNGDDTNDSNTVGFSTESDFDTAEGKMLLSSDIIEVN